jgi:hypothetical protein
VSDEEKLKHGAPKPSKFFLSVTGTAELESGDRVAAPNCGSMFSVK